MNHRKFSPLFLCSAAPVLFAEELASIKAKKAAATEAQWFEVKNQTVEAADIYIYDEITEYIPSSSAKGVVAQLNNLKAVPELNVRINSPGGSVFEGVAIYNALVRHPGTVIVHVDGIAASIASVIAMAGKEIRMADNAMMMIHNPMCLAFGEAAEMRKQADVLDQIKETIINVYAARTGRTREKLAKMMDEETWFTAKEAVEAKMADTSVKAMKLAAKFDITKQAFNKTPAILTAPPPVEQPISSTTPTNRHSRERRLALLEREVKVS